jgi:hypothetical protein
MYIQIHNENMYSDMQRRELFHFVFLERFLKATDAGLYSLKGGVNLRFFLKESTVFGRYGLRCVWWWSRNA